MGLEVAQRLVLRELPGELGAELRLAAGPAQEDHERARDPEGDLASEILLDHRQREIDAGRNAGGR